MRMSAVPASLLISLFALRGFAETPLQNTTADSSPPAQEQTQSSNETQQPLDKAQSSTLEVNAGQPVIKQKDLWNETGYIHPFVRMPKYILQDQKAIWTSPFLTVR